MRAISGAAGVPGAVRTASVLNAPSMSITASSTSRGSQAMTKRRGSGNTDCGGSCATNSGEPATPTIRNIARLPCSVSSMASPMRRPCASTNASLRATASRSPGPGRRPRSTRRRLMAGRAATGTLVACTCTGSAKSARRPRP